MSLVYGIYMVKDEPFECKLHYFIGVQRLPVSNLYSVRTASNLEKDGVVDFSIKNRTFKTLEKANLEVISIKTKKCSEGYDELDFPPNTPCPLWFSDSDPFSELKTVMSVFKTRKHSAEWRF